jgi:hypothetical protein
MEEATMEEEMNAEAPSAALVQLPCSTSIFRTFYRSTAFSNSLLR